MFSFFKTYVAGTLHNVNTVASFTLNFGPQHPASHGVLRLVVQLNGELVEKLDPHIGYLHRGSEKLLELKDFKKGSLYLDRLDYTSVLTQTHAYCLCVEQLNSYYLTTNSLIFRSVFDELARLLNHLLANSTHSLDIGSMAPLFWAFEERELIMELFEFVAGARMHVALYIPCQELSIFSIDFLIKLLKFLRNCYKSFTEVFIALFNNRVWKLRLVNIGCLSANAGLLLGSTGPILRSTGYFYDLRTFINDTYAFYWFLTFKSFLGSFGDCYDRFLIRSRELFESVLIIYQCITKINYLNNNYIDSIYIQTNKNYKILNNMESLFNLFYLNQKITVDTNSFAYAGIEAGKGEFGVFCLFAGSSYPQRVHLRSPAYNHLQLISLLGCGHVFADLVTLIGSLDLVFGEVDR